MSYLVLARRFRPQAFGDIVGQDHVTQTLANAVRSDRVAHAFLFTGARGVGKTTTARVLAKALNCEEGPTAEPCGQCVHCTGITASRAVDVQEIDGASNNSVEDIRTLREGVPYQPSSGRFKIYIIDEVHMLTTSAFNALLKTLEEPPEHVKFVFATTEPHKIPVTILSRCQRYDFRRIPTSQILTRLTEITTTESVKADASALALLAREAEGSMRDALSLLDRALAFDPTQIASDEMARLLGVADRTVLYELSSALLTGDPATALGAVEKVTTYGCDLIRFSHDLLRHLRNLVVARQCPTAPDLLDVPDEERGQLSDQAQDRDVAELHRLFILFSRTCDEISRSPHPRLLLEMSLARMAGLEPMRSLDELARSLEALTGSGARPVRAMAAPPARNHARPPAGARETKPQPPQSPARPARPAPVELEKRPPQAPDPEPPPPERSEARRAVGPGAGAEEGLWKALLAHIEREAPPLYHMLRYAEPAEIGPAGVRLIVPNNPFLRGEARDPGRLEALRLACKSVLGTDVAVRIDVADKVGQTPIEREHIERAARLADRKREATDHSIVRAALAEFDGARLDGVKLVKQDKKG